LASVSASRREKRKIPKVTGSKIFPAILTIHRMLKTNMKDDNMLRRISFFNFLPFIFFTRSGFKIVNQVQDQGGPLNLTGGIY
jgi:hypothetical protein